MNEQEYQQILKVAQEQLRSGPEDAYTDPVTVAQTITNYLGTETAAEEDE